MRFQASFLKLLALVVGAHSELSLSAEFTVTTDQDVVNGICTPTQCSIRDAIFEADRTPAVEDTIVIGDDTLILLGNGPLIVSTPLVIQGSGLGDEGTILFGDESTRIIEIAPDASLRLQNLGLSRGRAPFGAAIFNQGRLTIANVHLLDNQAQRVGELADGGAIFNAASAQLSIQDSLFLRNRANFGGGIYNNGGQITIIDTGFIANQAIGNDNSSGGAIRNWNNGSLTVENGRFFGNFATRAGAGVRNIGPAFASISRSGFIDGVSELGAGVSNSGNLLLVNNTFYDHVGPAVELDEGTANLTNNTLIENDVSMYPIFLGGGALIHKGGALTLNLNYIGSTIGGPNCNFAALTPPEQPELNFDSDGGCASFVASLSPALRPPDFSMGRWHATLDETSDLIDAAAGATQFCATEDQLGRSRPFDGDADGTALCDIGSYEYIEDDLFFDGFEDSNVVPPLKR